MEIQEDERAILLRIADDLTSVPEELEQMGREISSHSDNVHEKFRTMNDKFLDHVIDLQLAISSLPPSESAEIEKVLEKLKVLLMKVVDNNLQLTRHKSNITDSLRSLEHALAPVIHKLTRGKIFQHEIEKFKLKLEILRLRFIVGDYQFRETYHERMRRARNLALRIAKEVKSAISPASLSRNSLERKMRQIYRQMNDAVLHI